MISCDDYDYIEIACLFTLEVELHYASKRITGRAQDTQRGEDGQEGIVLLIGGDKHWFPLSGLKAMTALTDNPHFNHVEFTH